MVCACCGSQGHTVATCKKPGAKLIRKLKAENAALKKQKPKVRTRQRAFKRPASFRSLLKKRSDAYSGRGSRARVQRRDGQRRRQVDKRAVVSDAVEAYSRLVEAGYLDPPPARCPTCRRGALSCPRPAESFRGKPGDVIVRCNEDDCQARYNVLKFSKLKCLSGRPGRAFTCPCLHSVLRAYTNPATRASPRAYVVAKDKGLCSQRVALLFDELRGLEARAAITENKTIKLCDDVFTQRNIEGDGTVLRKFVVSRNNPHFAEAIKHAEAKLKRRGKLKGKKYLWHCHVRYAALAERAGRVTVCALPMRLVGPHAPPPPEAFDELRDAGLLSRCHKRAFLFCDGAHSWPKLVKHHNLENKAHIKLEEVIHYKGQFTKDVKKRARGQSSIAGTQSIDSRWRWLKHYVPHSIKGRVSRDVNPKLNDYVFSWQFRSNCNARNESLWETLGALVRRA